MNVEQTEMNNQYVIFKLEKEFYGLGIHFVETIEKVTVITRIPNAPQYVRGVINLRGEVVPVVDLRKRLALQQKEINDESRIIILSLEEMIVGILVDSSSEVLTIESDLIDNTSNLLDTNEDNYIYGIGKMGERMIIIVDILKILNLSI